MPVTVLQCRTGPSGYQEKSQGIETRLHRKFRSEELQGVREALVPDTVVLESGSAYVRQPGAGIYSIHCLLGSGSSYKQQPGIWTYLGYSQPPTTGNTGGAVSIVTGAAVWPLLLHFL
ncbi:hypothetical protein XELAEV_18024519mg [Xenopus laevis]|uniref:Uncharacterized protein n=1 Tax=Xenopus laevis TaxID=8355 RepID=A0A974D084_XENLA|nr:hypothetical protein XELAEV_18024519mg [Xenopus laevis]